MAYSRIFRTVGIFVQFQTHYSIITQEQFLHILNFAQADSRMFKKLAHLNT